MGDSTVIEDSLGIGTNLTVPSWVQAATDVELCTLRQEKRPTWISSGSEDTYDKQSAWFTCELCPQPHRYEEDSVLRSKETYWPFKQGDQILNRNMIFEEVTPIDCWVIQWGDVIRCKDAIERELDIAEVKNTSKIVDVWLNSDEWDRYRPKFITLTTANNFIPFQKDGTIGDQDMADLVRSFKKKITNFRRTKAFQAKVIGGVDYIEQTYNIEDKGISVNTHSHHVWLGKFLETRSVSKRLGSRNSTNRRLYFR